MCEASFQWDLKHNSEEAVEPHVPVVLVLVLGYILPINTERENILDIVVDNYETC